MPSGSTPHAQRYPSRKSQPSTFSLRALPQPVGLFRGGRGERCSGRICARTPTPDHMNRWPPPVGRPRSFAVTAGLSSHTCPGQHPRVHKFALRKPRLCFVLGRCPRPIGCPQRQTVGWKPWPCFGLGYNGAATMIRSLGSLGVPSLPVGRCCVVCTSERVDGGIANVQNTSLPDGCVKKNREKAKPLVRLTYASSHVAFWDGLSPFSAPDPYLRPRLRLKRRPGTRRSTRPRCLWGLPPAPPQ